MFNSFIKSLTKSLRHLIEALSINFLLSGQARRNRDDFMEIIFRLSLVFPLGAVLTDSGFPFQNDVNTGGGILAKTYLDATTYHFGETIPLDKAETDEAKEAKRNALDFVEQSFTGVKMPIQEVERGFRFWDSVSPFWVGAGHPAERNRWWWRCGHCRSTRTRSPGSQTMWPAPSCLRSLSARISGSRACGLRPRMGTGDRRGSCSYPAYRLITLQLTPLACIALITGQVST